MFGLVSFFWFLVSGLVKTDGRTLEEPTGNRAGYPFAVGCCCLKAGRHGVVLARHERTPSGDLHVAETLLLQQAGSAVGSSAAPWCNCDAQEGDDGEGQGDDSLLKEC